MCATACPVDINTGDLVRRLRAETASGLSATVWKAAAAHWDGATTAVIGALTVAAHLPAALVTAASAAARAVLGSDEIPAYTRGLPGGGSRRTGRTSPEPSAVFFPSCVNTMFGPEAGSLGSAKAFRRLCERAGVGLAEPAGVAGLCCGTPWKSKGHLDGHRSMVDRTAAALIEATDRGRLPIVCDAASCTEGLDAARATAAAARVRLTVIDAVEFTATRRLDGLSVRPLDSLALHRTCSTTSLGVNDHLSAISRRISDDTREPVNWGCCAFAGDWGMLHPELTASATRAEASEILERHYAAYASANRTCELGMTRATGKPYRHVLEILEEQSR